MKTFHIINLGCKVNRVESDSFSQILENQGLQVTPLPDADIIVINTCTVTGEADKKTRKAVNHALRENPRAKVLITGCASAINPDYFCSLNPRVQIVPKADMPEQLNALSQNTITSTQPLASQAHYPTRVGVKVQDGCNHACTYCIIHVARGKATSRPLAEITAECESLITQGVNEIVLTGINLGSYAYQNTSLTQLLVELSTIAKAHQLPDKPPCRFRISSVEPMDIDDGLIELLATSDGHICRHLHLPLQSGSSKVLAEMNRPYSTEEYVKLVDRLYASIPNLSLSTDIIVGFPGETDEDFTHTLEVAKHCKFSKIHVFPYSQRQGTPAAKRPDQIDPRVKRDRALQLRNLGKALRQADWDNRLGTVEFAVVEERGIAMSESHYELTAPQNEATGSLIPLTLTNEILQDSQF